MRTIILGGGAAGVSTALALKELDPSRAVELWEPHDVLGGMASSAQTPEGEWYNNGVQGIHQSFVHTRALLAAGGFPDSTLVPTSLTSCFVTPDMTWISGVTDMSTHKRSIQCFRRMCKAVRATPRFYGIWTIVDACIFFAVSRSFVNNVVLPVLALFFGTGNQVAKLPAALGVQVFNLGDSDSGNAVTIFDLDMEHFIVTGRNNMLALPPLRAVYTSLHRLLEARGVVVRMAQRAQAVQEDESGVLVTDALGVIARADHVVMAMQVPDAAAVLPTGHKALKYLRKVRYYHDVTITHRDTEHMRAHFAYNETMPINYFIHERSAQSMDMGFALHLYQRVTAPLFQTLFLEEQGTTATAAAEGRHAQVPVEAPRPALVAREDHWYQLGHTVSHFVNCVANIPKFQGPRVFFAGSWTLVNSHEVAVMSGILAAQHVVRNYTTFPRATFGPASPSFIAYAKLVR
jgi:predicted NAD/FAD-dependent oxidoreductase